MTVLVTGSGGLVGSAAVQHFIEIGERVVGIDNNMRAYFFGPEASTRAISDELEHKYLDFYWYDMDIREADTVEKIVVEEKPTAIIHAAAQPAHDWAAKEPLTDFGVNAVGTLNLLEAARKHCPDAPFVYCSTSKVYGDNPNRLPLLYECPKRYDLPPGSEFYDGITSAMSIDRCTHSLFGVSKASADLFVQEYGNYFGMPTVCFRPGCISGAGHQGAELHGFLSYLMRCTVTGQPYTVFGYKGKQVRCNIHADDLVFAFDEFIRAPSSGAVYNIGGGRWASCSMLEAIALCEEIAGKALDWTYSEESRIGDHLWWISSNAEFQQDYPEWELIHDVRHVLEEIHDNNRERWCA